MKLTQLFLCSATLALPLTLHAATQKSDDRWFDVEIILFSQLGDKSQLKESFPETSVLPKHRRVEDLLSTYLNPDIRGLKHLLPSCSSPQYGEHLVEKNAKLPALFSEKSLAELAQLATQASGSELENSVTEQNSGQFSDATNITNTTILSGSTTNGTTTLDEGNSNQALTDTANNTSLNNTLSNDTLSNETFTSNALAWQTALSDTERAKIQSLVMAAEREFQSVKFQYTAEIEPRLLCKIDEARFADFQTDNPDLDYYGFSVDKMPLLIDGKEEVGNNKTHLLSKASLQLGDIIQDLRYSKDFRPLLHMGWRQVARPEKESVPVRVYAGENFVADHQKKLARFNKQKNQQLALALAKASEQNSIDILALQNQVKMSQEEQLQMAQSARIQEIIAQISQVGEDTEALLASLNAQDLSLKLGNETPLVASPPQAPVQPWFIDGFFNIHLKHYLFITADFNILDKNLAELATAQLAATTDAITNTKRNALKSMQAKAIRFKQDRRVISGEVHYFDHPYMGMIVQIRPYKKPALEEE